MVRMASNFSRYEMNRLYKKYENLRGGMMAKRPNILKLATKISLESLTYTGITYTDPEYRILDPIVTDDMCRVMMHLRPSAAHRL